MLIESIEQFKQLKNEQPDRQCTVDMLSDEGESRHFMSLNQAWAQYQLLESNGCRDSQITKIIVLD